MKTGKTVDVAITELDDAVKITIGQEGKIPASLTVPPEQAISLATSIIRIANKVRQQEGYSDCSSNHND
jgi:hypothetical protein